MTDHVSRPPRLFFLQRSVHQVTSSISINQILLLSIHKSNPIDAVLVLDSRDRSPRFRCRFDWTQANTFLPTWLTMKMLIYWIYCWRIKRRGILLLIWTSTNQRRWRRRRRRPPRRKRRKEEYEHTRNQCFNVSSVATMQKVEWRHYPSLTVSTTPRFSLRVQLRCCLLWIM